MRGAFIVERAAEVVINVNAGTSRIKRGLCPPKKIQRSNSHKMSLCLADWVLAADGDSTSPALSRHKLLGLPHAIHGAPQPQRECAAWLSAATATSKASKKAGGGQNSWVQAEHLASLTSCFPAAELEAAAASVLNATLPLLRQQELPQTRICALRAVETLVERLVGDSRKGASATRKAAVVSALPKLMPLMFVCATQNSTADISLVQIQEIHGACLSCLCSLLYALRSSMRPYLARIETSISGLLSSSGAQVSYCCF